jgi:superfamily II DNA or RNA helicase
MELRKWQKESIEFFNEKNKNAVFSVPTGAGKTFVAIEILKRLTKEMPNIRTLIIVPKNVILEMWCKELREHGFHWNKVGIYNRDCKEYSRITITTNASALKLNYKMFDFIIADELHNMGTDRMLKLIRHKFKYKLGLSATPERSDYNHWKIYEAFDFNVYEYSIKDALEDNILNKFEFYDIVLDLPEKKREEYDELSMTIGTIMKTIGSFSKFMALSNTDKRKLTLLKLMNARKEMIWNYQEKLRIVSALCKEYSSNSKILVFSQYNKTTNNLYYYLGSEGVKAALVHSSLSDKERAKALKDFKEDRINVMLATKVLDEGYNLPKIDVGIILAGERTARQTIQRLGRVLRKKEINSKLFQIYVSDTFESEVAEERSKFFKELSESYEKIEVDKE